MIYAESFVVRYEQGDSELSIRSLVRYEYEPAERGDFGTPSEGPLVDVLEIIPEYAIAKFGDPDHPATLERRLVHGYETESFVEIVRSVESQLRAAIIERRACALEEAGYDS